LARNALKLFAFFSIKSVRNFATFVGNIAWFFNTKSKKITIKNIELCFPELSDPERKKLAKKSLIESLKTAAEMGAMYFWESEKILKLVERVENLEILDRAIKSGKGIILLAPHQGNFEMMRHFAASKTRFITLYQPLKTPELDALSVELRSKNGVEALPTTARGIAAVFRELQKGAVTAILPDSSPARDSGAVFAPFFGIETFTATLLSKAARKTGAIVIACAAFRSPEGFIPRFFAVDETLYLDDSRAAAAAVNVVIEECVRLDPAQYFWEYRRFKVRPKGEKSFY
jgi:KDO2-lipid IV(A) lauroyltransferase